MKNEVNINIFNVGYNWKINVTYIKKTYGSGIIKLWEKIRLHKKLLFYTEKIL